MENSTYCDRYDDTDANDIRWYEAGVILLILILVGIIYLIREMAVKLFKYIQI